MTWILAALITASLTQQPAVAAAVEMSPAEQAFQQTMTDVVLEGFFTVGDGTELHPDRYEINSVTKVKDGVWRFAARVQYNKKDFPVTTQCAGVLRGRYAGDVAHPPGDPGHAGAVRYAAGDLQGRLCRHVGRRRHRRQDVRQHRQERAEVDAAPRRKLMRKCRLSH